MPRTSLAACRMEARMIAPESTTVPSRSNRTMGNRTPLMLARRPRRVDVDGHAVRIGGSKPTLAECVHRRSFHGHAALNESYVPRVDVVDLKPESDAAISRSALDLDQLQHRVRAEANDGTVSTFLPFLDELELQRPAPEREALVEAIRVDHERDLRGSRHQYSTPTR